MDCQQRRRTTAFPAVLDGPEAAQLGEVMFEFFGSIGGLLAQIAACHNRRTDCQGFIRESSFEAHDKFSTNESYGTLDEKVSGTPFSQCI